MSQAIDLSPTHHKIVSDILYEYVPKAKVLVFGSRAKWSAKDSSDLDLAIDADRPLTRREESALRDAASPQMFYRAITTERSGP